MLESCDFWIAIPGFEGYSVNPNGMIRSIDRFIPRSDTGKLIKYKGMIIKCPRDRRGYHRLTTSICGVKTSIRNHRAVALAYLPNPENKEQVNHKDGIKENNSISNLEWCTNSENQIHAIESGLKVPKRGKNASRFESAISVYKDGLHLYDLSGNAELAEYGYDYRLVSAVILGKRKSHKGCTFKRNQLEN